MFLIDYQIAGEQTSSDRLLLESQQWDVESLPSLTSEQLIESAEAIAVELETRVIFDADGSVNWCGFHDLSIPSSLFAQRGVAILICVGRE
ncbi:MULTISPECIES: hypothetical protein [unclassified Nostoc]|uniref:hypothetical protein n=1 Tax=unclassified Nostoc TaxID=2593658 RepID=UPI002AD315A2|nr:hypothetical protein [Nostoc sp. DedQUE03]MDZ7973115.1 hypothetical protein [Nostoc sp. DedQUE03]MDZ8046916.1 hypothetical protein [Nostoc sp. DedQUE02]